MDNQNMLMEKLAAPDNLLAAWRAVRGNIPSYRRQRSAGPDGVTLAEFERDLTAQLYTLRQMLLKGRYQPQLPGLFTMPKRSGGERKLAVLNVADRVAQRAAQQVIEPLFEPSFLPCNFGYRPGRSMQDATYCVRRLRQHGYRWVVDGDIAACFDTLDHRLLLQKINKRINDHRVIDLLEKWLNIGVLEHGQPAEKPNLLEQGWQKASKGLQRSADWTFNLLGQQNRYDPYSDFRFNQPAFDPVRVEQIQQEDDPQDAVDPESFYQVYDGYEHKAMQRSAVQQIAAGGLFLGTGWARQGLSKLAPAAIAALKSPTGREVLKHGLMIGGGALGAAAGIAVTAYFIYRQAAPPGVGVLQGSPLSPLLANIYLHSFDLSLTRSGYRLVRFADDWVILCPERSVAERAYNQSILALDQIHLKVNTEKTRILTPLDHLEWLGEVIT